MFRIPLGAAPGRLDKALQTRIVSLSNEDFPFHNRLSSLNSVATVPNYSGEPPGGYAAVRTDSRPTLASRIRSKSRPSSRPILPVTRSTAVNRSESISSTRHGRMAEALLQFGIGSLPVRLHSCEP